MSSPPVHVTAITVSAESPKAVKRLESIEIQINHRPYALIRNNDGSLCQQFQDTLTLSTRSHITISYKRHLFFRKTWTLDVQRMFAGSTKPWTQGLSAVQDDIRVKFSCQAAQPEVPQFGADQPRTVQPETVQPVTTEPGAVQPKVPYVLSDDAASFATQTSETLVPTTRIILKDCPRFRILVIGKTGVGKSNLIKTVFGIEKAHVSDFQRGKADIHEGLTSPVNERFILHDSVGIEPGDEDKYEVVKDFIQSKQTGPLADRLHAVWFCIQTPYAGGRHLEAGAEDFFQSKSQTLGSIPLIVVYTKFDLAVNEVFLKPSSYGVNDDDNIVKNARLKAVSSVKEMHDRVAKGSEHLPYAVISTETNYEYTSRDLIDLTYREVGMSDTPEAQVTSVLTQMAQRIDPDLKIHGSIDVGKKRYWKTLGISPDFTGRTMWDCLSVIHTDIVAVWNFNDPTNYLHNNEFKELVIKLIPEISETKSRLVPKPNKIFTLTTSALTAAVAAFIAAAATPAAPIVIPVFAGLAAAVWLYDVYQKAKHAQQIFMVFIVDLTLIMEILFILTVQHHNKLTRRAIKAACRVYEDSDVMKQAHDSIQAYHDIAGRDAALEMIESLIRHKWGGDLDTQKYYNDIGNLDLGKLNLDKDEHW